MTSNEHIQQVQVHLIAAREEGRDYDQLGAMIHAQLAQVEAVRELTDALDEILVEVTRARSS